MVDTQDLGIKFYVTKVCKTIKSNIDFVQGQCLIASKIENLTIRPILLKMQSSITVQPVPVVEHHNSFLKTPRTAQELDLLQSLGSPTPHEKSLIENARVMPMYPDLHDRILMSMRPKEPTAAIAREKICLLGVWEEKGGDTSYFADAQRGGGGAGCNVM